MSYSTITRHPPFYRRRFRFVRYFVTTGETGRTRNHTVISSPPSRYGTRVNGGLTKQFNARTVFHYAFSDSTERVPQATAEFAFRG